MPAPAERIETAAVLLSATFESADTLPAPIVGQVFILEPPVDNSDFRSRIRLVMDHVPAGEHAFHIHAGMCKQAGSVVLPLSMAPSMTGLAKPLSAGSDGTVDVTIPIPAGTLTVHDLQHGDYSLHVHRRAGPDHGPSIACANL